MKIDYIGKCEMGKVREVNQDAIAMHVQDDVGIFVVADGMGGHSHGERASSMIVGKIAKWWEGFTPQNYDNSFSRMIQSIKQIVEEANIAIFEQYNQDEICGSTVVLLFIYKNYYAILHAGDSRCYICKKKHIKQITVDDVWENQVGISRAERMNKRHPNRGKLVNAVGTQKELQCRVETNEWEPGMLFLLCSDGLYKMCQEKDMERILRKYHNKGRFAEACGDMISMVYENGARDNISVILVWGMGN